MTDTTISTVSDAVIAISTFGGFVTGLRGLDRWHVQSYWKENHDLAEQLLSCVYEIGHVVRAVRLQNTAGSESEGEGDTREARQASTYGSRWGRINEVRSKLGAAMTEAEVIWGRGTPLHDAEIKLNTHLGKLFLAMKHFLADNDGSKEFFARSDRDILYSSSGPGGEQADTYDTELDHIIVEFETYLKQYLPQKSRSKNK
jgi:hypothetical protein